MDTAIHSPHDKFFKHSMSEPQVAQEFFQHYLPEQLLAQTDLTTLTVHKTSFVDDEYKSFEADIVYTAMIKQEQGYFYILCEHQSSVDKLLSLRMQQYMLNLIANHQQQHPTEPLPFVYPLIVYTGIESYTASTDFTELFADPKLMKSYWLEPIQLIDVCRLDDDDIMQRQWFGLAEFAFKYRQAQDIGKILETFFSWITRVESWGSAHFAKIVLKYLFSGMEVGDVQLFFDKAKGCLSSELEGEMMTLEQLIEQRGRTQGIEQGMQQGMQQGMKHGIQKGIQQGSWQEKQMIAKKLLATGMSIATVAQMTGLSAEIVLGLSEKTTIAGA